MPRIVAARSGRYNRYVMPHRQMFYAAHGCGKTQRLAQAASAALHETYAPRDLLALAIHPPSVQALRATLRAVTGADIPATTVRLRAQRVLEESPARAYLPPNWDRTQLLSGIDRRRLIRQAWATAGGGSGSLHENHASQPGALDWITRLFDQFAQWAGTADPSRFAPLTIGDARLAELWQAYTIYLTLCRQYGVVAFTEVFNRAADVLRGAAARSMARPRVLLLDDLDLFQPAELSFVTALIDPQTNVLAAAAQLPAANSPIALEQHLARWLDHHGVAAIACSGVARSPTLTVGEYAAPDDEVHAIAQRILAAGCTNFTEYAIVAFDREVVPLAQRILPQYGVPVAGLQPRDGYTLLIAPLAHAGIKLIARHTLTPHETAALLRHRAFGLAPADMRAAVEALPQSALAVADDDLPRWPSALSDAGRARLAALHTATVAARHLDAPMSVRLRYWLRALSLEEPCWAQTEAVLPAWAAAIDRRQWTRWIGFLEQSEALHAQLGTPLTPEDAVEVVASAQALIEPEGDPTANAVQIWQPAALGGCTARTVFVAGLHEHALPQPLPPLPLADAAQLAMAFGALPNFVAPQTDDRAAAWGRGLHEFQRAIGRAAAAAHLSYSRTDRQERKRLPSPVLAAQLGLALDRHGRLSGGTITIETAPPAEYAPECATLADRPAQLAQHSMLQPHAPLSVPIAGESPFRTSPSAIEDYFTCPRRCFYARRLHLYDVASSPRQALGQVVHNALDNLLAEAAATAITEERAAALVERHWITDVQPWGSRLKQAVFKQLAERAVTNVARYEAGRDQTPVGSELTFEWTIADTDIVLSGRIDRIDRGADGLQVIDYKLGQNSPSIGGLLAEFVQPPGDETWRPGDIQLPVYVLAIEGGAVPQVAGERVATVALLYPLELYTEKGRLSAKGRRELRIIDHDETCAACGDGRSSGTLCRNQLADVQRLIVGAVSAMRAGRWEASPREGSKTCSSCPFRPICSDPQ